MIGTLKDIIRLALKACSIKDRLIELIATWLNGDARIALQTVKAAAVRAQTGGRDLITLEELKEAAL